ncbi:MAG: hypothetical protein ACRDHP_19830, partial [Ktedonobacterales bacterium]
TIYRARKLTAFPKLAFAGQCLIVILALAAILGHPVLTPAWLICILFILLVIRTSAWDIGQFRASWLVRGRCLVLLPEGFVEKTSRIRAVPYASLASFTLDPEQYVKQHKREVTLRWKTIQGAEDALTLDERYREPIPLALRMLDAHAAWVAFQAVTSA